MKRESLDVLIEGCREATNNEMHKLVNCVSIGLWGICSGGGVEKPCNKGYAGVIALPRLFSRVAVLF
jgi:hypothetical protein